MSRPLAVVVVSYASADLLAEHLVRVHAGLPGAHVVVVDCFSSLAERGRVRELAAVHGWHAELLDENRGFGGGVNAGVRVALAGGAQDLLLLNPDASVPPDAVAALQRAVADDRARAVAPVIRRADGRPWFSGSDLYLADGATRGVARRAEHPGADRRPWLTGACLLLPAELWLRVGGFDEDYFLYWEDVDLSWRVLAAGGSLAVVPEAVAVHDEGGTQVADAAVRRAKSPDYYYFNVRNRLLFAARHLDAAGVRRWWRATPRAVREVLLRGGRRQFLRPAAPVGAALRGVRDGRRAVRAALRAPAAPDRAGAPFIPEETR